MATIAQRSFAAGEVSPALYARVDQQRYSTGLRQCRNTVILRTGGSSMRPGLNFVAERKDSGDPGRLIPFISSAAQAYVLELGESYMRFYKNGQQILNAPLNITRVSNSSPCTVTVTNHGLSNGQEVYVSGIVGVAQMNGRNFKVQVQDANNIKLYYFSGSPFDSTLQGAWVSGGTVQSVYEIATPYSSAYLDQLQFVQSADVMTLTSQYNIAMTLKHFSDLNWTLTPLSFGSGQAPPTNLSYSTSSTNPSVTYSFAVTSVSATNEESIPYYQTLSGAYPNATTAWYLNASGGAGALYNNFYAKTNGIYGFVGEAAAGSMFFFAGADQGAPQVADQPPRGPGPSDYFGSIGYYQQRLLLGRGIQNPAGTIASRTGHFSNFYNGSSVKDDDSLNFTIIGRLVQEIRHYLDLGTLVVLTSEGEFTVEGNANGILSPDSLNVRQTSFIGSSTLTPIVIGNSAIFVQARGSAIFDLGYDFNVRGFNGNELSIFSNHLFDNYRIKAWAFQKRPHQIVWALRNDGILLSLTYIKGEAIVAWARHDTIGLVEDVVCVPEGTSDAVYVSVLRTLIINGQGVSKRFIERLATNADGDFINSVYMDCALTYDGRNKNSSYTVALSGGVNWTYDETLTLTMSGPTTFFSVTDVGSEIQLTSNADGQVIRFIISAITSPLVVQGRANRTVPASLRNQSSNHWAKAIQTVKGLYNLEGQAVSVLGDGFVVASPNRKSEFANGSHLTVYNNQVILDKPYAVIHIGLPFIADIETLDIDTVQGEPLVGKEILISAVHAHTQNTRGFWAGAQPPSNDTVDPLENLTETKTRNQNVENMNQPASMKTDVLELNIQGNYSRGGRVFIRQVDPVPTSILAIEPAGFIPPSGGN